jgi:nitrous oxidase accessory protein
VKPIWRFSGFLILLAMVQVSHAATVKVCASCSHKTVHAALQAANSFDTVIISQGTYKEVDLHVMKPLTIIGLNNPLIDGEDRGEVFTIEADSVSIYGIHIINVGTSYTTDYAAIRFVKSKYFTIANVFLEKLFFGIYLEKSEYGKVYNNRIIGDAVDEFSSGNGIHLWYSHHIDVHNNTVENTRDGIYLEFSNFISISANESRKNLRYGLHFMFSNDDVYTKNVFEHNGAGVAVMFSRNIKMINNTFQQNWGPAAYGLLLKEINDAEIEGNIFNQNTTAIHIEGSNRIAYNNNTFRNNGWAVKVLGACYTNAFRGNSFLYNSFDVSYNSKLNDNVFEGNYWSNYTGYDLDKDGYGDVPYRPVKLFSYIIHRTPETIVLLRSLFMDIIDFSEKVSPIFTPDNLLDSKPLMKPQS